MSFNQNANNNTREIAITRRPSLVSQAPPTTGKMETTEVIHSNFVERIAYSSCIPGKILIEESPYMGHINQIKT